MLNSNLRVALVFGALSAIAGSMYACGGDDAATPAGCTPFAPQVCPVPGTGAPGMQTCAADGQSFGPCIANAGGTGGASGFSGGAGGIGGTGGVGGSTECGVGEVCNASQIGVSFCGVSGSQLPASCPTMGASCGTSGGTCNTIPVINTLGCIKTCTAAGGTGGTGGIGGTGGVGGTGGMGGTGGVGGTGGIGGTGGTGGTGGVPAGCPMGMTCTDLAAFGFPVKACTAGVLPPACESGACPSLPGGACMTVGPLGMLCVKVCQ